jgi:hypothetical protein
VPGIFEQAVQFRRRLAAAEPGVSSPACCAEIAEELARTENACAAARVRFASRAAKSGEHTKRGFADGPDWMAAASGSSRRDARDALETVRRLDARPEVQDAVAAGAVSLEQAAQIVTAPAEDEAELLELARGSALGAVRARGGSRRWMSRNCMRNARPPARSCTGRTTLSG